MDFELPQLTDSQIEKVVVGCYRMVIGGATDLQVEGGSIVSALEGATLLDLFLLLKDLDLYHGKIPDHSIDVIEQFGKTAWDEWYTDWFKRTRKCEGELREELGKTLDRFYVGDY